eukprot:13457824-Ditylum_brightwellii.AAC.1
MPSPPPDTGNKIIQAYHYDKAEDKKRMNLLIGEENTYQLHLAYNAPLGPNLPLLLPKYDPSKPFPIVLPEYNPSMLTPISKSQCADWDKTHPTAKIKITMKVNHEFEYEFLRDGHGKIDFNNGSYHHHLPTRVIPKYESKSRFLCSVATVKLQS